MDNILRAIKDCKSIALIVHNNPDSDCIGSATALLIALRKMNKKVHIFAPSSIASRLLFLLDDEWIGNTENLYDACIAVDVAEIGLMGDLKEKVYDKSPIRCCIDHHTTNNGYADYSYVDPQAAAAGEIIYFFIKDYLKVDITVDIAMRLYAAIASDTGSFRYSNTTPRTHLVAAELLSRDFDAPAVMRTLFERKTASQLMLNAEVTSNLKFFMDGKICVAKVDKAMLSKYSMTFDDADDIASLPRSIAGVEVGIYIKIKDERECKVSLRSNEYVDVSAIAKSLGGGGHIRAAGVTVNATAEETEDILLTSLKKVI